MLHRRLTAALLTALVGIGLVSLPSPVSAAVSAPTGLAPSGTSVANNPVLSWNEVPGAVSYRVELSRSGTFDSLDYLATTVNRQATPTVTLPSGELNWRVRAVSASSAVSPWSNATFTLNAKAAPAQLSPTDGQLLPQPEEPPLLVWAPVNGATSYELAYGTDPNLSTATSLTTRNTSYAFTTPQAQAVYFWKIRAVLGNGQATEWSGIRSYDVQSLVQPDLRSPETGEVVSDVVLEWDSVPGASRYEVRVSTDQNFTTVTAQETSVATRWSPSVTLNNDQYWWQVRAYDSQGQTKDWAALTQRWQFERRWQFGSTTALTPERPALVYPTNGVAPVTDDPFFYEWRPVRLASEYKLQMGTDPNFSPTTFDECITKQTTFTPATGVLTSGPLGCKPASAGTYYWRVQAVDGPKPVLTPWSDIWSFTYRPGSVGLRAPANGATVAVPTMRWNQALGAERYKLTYSYGSTTKSVTTYSNSYTPTTTIPTTTPTVSWYVQAIYANNNVSAQPLGGGRTFTLDVPPATAPEPDALSTDPFGDRFPSLSWKAVAGADHYKVFVGTAGTGTFQVLPGEFAYPAGTDLTKTHLGAKDYDWFVLAYDDDNVTISSGSLGSYTVDEVGAVAGQGIAHTGTELDSGLRCGMHIGSGIGEGVCPVRQTPVLDWAPVDGASSYLVYLARDESLTNMVATFPVTTHNTRWTPTEMLPDSQAGEAYYWVVRPCKAATVCAPDPTRATNAFDKTSHQVVTTSPADEATVADAVTFRWTDYLVTNSVPTGNGRSRVEAREYEIDVSTSPTFQNILDNATVDQTTYTADTKTYPEGPLFWRVSALDGSGNTVGTSAVNTATKQSPAVTLLSPGNGSISPGTPALRWQPRAFTASYDLEVYENNDVNFSLANRVLAVNSRLSAYSLTTPLPAAELAYVWRVRSKDVSGNTGPWSDARRFTVRGAAPTQLAPVADLRISATMSLFTWSAVPGASSYRFERRPSGGTTATETVITVGVAWAPTRALPDGSAEWRVSTLDAVGKIVATSPWRTFRVDATAPTVIATTPSSSAKPGTNVTATFSEPVQGVTSATMKLFRGTRTHPVPAHVTLSADRLKAVLSPTENLLRGRTYRAVVTSGVTDGARNPLAKREWTFTVVG